MRLVSFLLFFPSLDFFFLIKKSQQNLWCLSRCIVSSLTYWKEKKLSWKKIIFQTRQFITQATEKCTGQRLIQLMLFWFHAQPSRKGSTQPSMYICIYLFIFLLPFVLEILVTPPLWDSPCTDHRKWLIPSRLRLKQAWSLLWARGKSGQVCLYCRLLITTTALGFCKAHTRQGTQRAFIDNLHPLPLPRS